MAASTSVPAALDGPPARADQRHPSAERNATLLLLALLAACAYAAFSAGATRYPQLTWIQVALAATALAASAGWAVGGGIRWRASRPAVTGLALLAGLAAWSSLSVLWSIAPDRTWLEANRTLAYALTVGLGIAYGSSEPRAIERAGLGVLGVSLLVALYAFATKALPGISVPGLFDLDQAGGIGRLRAPLGYWNADALLCAIGLPFALVVAGDRGLGMRLRAGGLIGGLLLVCVIGMTYSRGGLVAALVGLAVLSTLGGARLGGIVTFGLIGLAAVPVLGLAFSLPGLADNEPSMAARQDDGLILLGSFLLAGALLVLVARFLWRREDEAGWTPERTRTTLRVAAIVGLLAVVVGLAAAAASPRGLPGTVSDQVASFTEPSTDTVDDPGRLVTTTSGNRSAWWSEAVGSWTDRPVGGWGAGSFAATHLRYRDNALAVTQAHSVPLQLLSETGIVGLGLFLGALAGLGLAALRRVRAAAAGPERELGVAAFAAVSAWAVHGLYDWDWNIPGVTLPALLLLGVLAGGSGRARRRVGPPAGVLVVAALVLSLVAVSALLPAWAEEKSSSAQVAVQADSDPAQLQDAAAQAELAARLDPVSIQPLLASAAIARRRGRPLEARRFLLDAVERQPDSVSAWLNLAAASFALADRAGFERAALRALALDPRSPRTRRVALAAVAYRAPTGGSATAVGTPLTPAPVQAPPEAPVAPAAPVDPGAPAVPAPGPGGATGATGTGGAPAG